MRATSSGSNTHLWSSPIPYLFGGLAVILTLIAVALLMLACSYRKRDSDTSCDAEAKPVQPMIPPLDLEPRIAVIMAGDERPTYLAKPVTTVPSCCDSV
ncbi:uncharacterized protein J3R85_004736 [Psidium guajava]|nr:uncharacterized protein J3R85_004736 [Psidium guajava]